MKIYTDFILRPATMNTFRIAMETNYTPVRRDTAPSEDCSAISAESLFDDGNWNVDEAKTRSGIGNSGNSRGRRGSDNSNGSTSSLKHEAIHHKSIIAQHNYHDHSNDAPPPASDDGSSESPPHATNISFPARLYEVSSCL